MPVNGVMHSVTQAFATGCAVPGQGYPCHADAIVIDRRQYGP